MDNQILLLASKMLKIASEEFSNHGCNDLDKDVIELSNTELCKQIEIWNGDDEWSIDNLDQVPDWMLMDFLKDQLISALK